MYQTSELLVDANRRCFRCCIQMRAQHTGVRKDDYRVKKPERRCIRESWNPSTVLHLVSLTQPQGRCVSKASSLLAQADLTADVSESSILNGTPDPARFDGDTKLGVPLLLLCLNDRVFIGRLLLKKQNMELENSPGQGWRDGMSTNPQ